jgi:hypothetical protein
MFQLLGEGYLRQLLGERLPDRQLLRYVIIPSKTEISKLQPSATGDFPHRSRGLALSFKTLTLANRKQQPATPHRPRILLELEYLSPTS